MRHIRSKHAVWIAALIAAAGAGCDGDPVGLPEPGGEIIVAFDQDLARWPADAWAFQNATVVDGALELTVSYGGGCEPHDLWLLAVDGFRTLPTAGPLPTAAVPLFLAHDAHGDMCEAYITRTESFRLTSILLAFRDEYGTGGTLILQLPAGQGSADTVEVAIDVP